MSGMGDRRRARRVAVEGARFRQAVQRAAKEANLDERSMADIEALYRGTNTERMTIEAVELVLAEQRTVHADDLHPYLKNKNGEWRTYHLRELDSKGCVVDSFRTYQPNAIGATFSALAAREVLVKVGEKPLTRSTRNAGRAGAVYEMGPNWADRWEN